MQSFSLSCFGVADGWPSAGRNHSAFLYQFENESFLMDCGDSTTRTYKAAGLSWDLIDHIFISHLHFDHVGGLFMFIQGLWLEGRKKELWIHAPADGIEPIRQLLRAACIFDEVLPFRLVFKTLQPQQAIAWSDLRLTPFHTSHLAGFQQSFQSVYPQRYEAFSFLIERGPLRIGHSADIGAPEDLLPLVEHGLDLLVCELAHVPAESLFRFLQDKAIQRFVFIHLTQEWVEKLKEIQELAGQILGPDRIWWPNDGQVFAAQKNGTCTLTTQISALLNQRAAAPARSVPPNAVSE